MHRITQHDQIPRNRLEQSRALIMCMSLLTIGASVYITLLIGHSMVVFLETD